MSRPINSTRYFGIPCILKCAVLFFILLGVAQPASPATPILRHVLVLYNSLNGATPTENIVFENCQTILNYYGLLCEYRDVNQRPLPGVDKMDRYLGVITAFTSAKMENPRGYFLWLNQQLDAGRKVVVLDELGGDSSNNPEIERLRGDACRKLGFEETGEFTSNRAVIRYERKDPEGVEFERKYPPLPPEYEEIKPIDPRVKTYLSLKRTDRKDSESSVILTSPSGGYARGEFILWQDPATFRKQWYLNPFRFFEDALGLTGLPRPDPTTLNGLRVAFSHIDGDAFTGLSKIDKRSLCGEIIFNEILKRYDFPVSVSIIVGEVDPAVMGDASYVALAKKVFALPNVEPASHSFSHPFYWDPAYKGKDRYSSQYGFEIPGYAFDLKMEIDHSLEYISKGLSPPDKPCKIMFWSGNCIPTEEAVARCDQLGCLNINGGDTLFDDYNNSYTSVSPLYRSVGGRIQYHIGQANDNILTNLWKGPYYGYRKIITTMERTGSPRRIKPINIYYHFYSGEYHSSLKALQDVYDWVIEHPIAPVFTSEYIRMVQSFISVQMERDGNAFVIKDYGDCLTVRFDAAQRVPDVKACENVIGYAKEPQGLYVSLAPGKGRAVIRFAEKPLSSLASEDAAPYVATASGWIRNMESGPQTLKLQFKGYGTGRMQVGGWVPGKICHVRGSAVRDQDIELSADDKGFLTIEPVQDGILEITGQ